jgi:hypothetical protein
MTGDDLMQPIMWKTWFSSRMVLALRDNKGLFHFQFFLMRN